MLLNEIINKVGMTKRAVKYYEEKGLLAVDKDNNGYRNYSAQDVETLKKISVYRKLGISIKDIQNLLETGDKSILKCTLCQGHYDFSFSDFYFIFVCCVEASK